MPEKAQRQYPQVQRFTSPMLAVFSEMARMHSAHIHGAIPSDVCDASMARCDSIRRMIERRIASAAGEGNAIKHTAGARS